MSYTPYAAYGSAESFGQAAYRLASERNDLRADYGYLSPEHNGYQTGRVVADTPNGRTVVYNTNNDEWDQVGRWNGGVYKKIAKTRYAKCAKSSKKCRHSHHKNAAKRSRRRNRNSHSR